MDKKHHAIQIRISSLPSWHSLAFRWGILLVIQATELLGLSMRFDAAVFAGDKAWWTQFAYNSPKILRGGLAFIAAFLLLIAPRLSEIVQETRQFSQKNPWLRRFLLHLVVFGFFWRATLTLFVSVQEGNHLPSTLMAGWIGLGLASFFLWLGTLAPFGFWFWLVSKECWSLSVATLTGVLAWLFGSLAQLLWQPLAVGTFWMSYRLLELIYADAVYDASNYTLGTSGFQVNIAPECSGYEGIGLVLLFLTLYLWLFRIEIRFPQAFLLFPFGIVAIWLANAVRITILITIGTSFSSEAALGGFHSQAGWIAFITITLGLILATRRLRWFALATPETTVSTSDTERAAAALLVPFLALMASIMLSSVLSDGFDSLYPLRVVITTGVLAYFSSIYIKWDWNLSWHAFAIGIAAFALWLLLEPAEGNGAKGLENALSKMSYIEKLLWLACRVIGSVLIIPLTEELAFRGYLLKKLASQDIERMGPERFSLFAFLLSSLAFGLLHSRWLSGFLAGMAYALAFYWRGKLCDAVVAHVTMNALIAVCVLVFGYWSLWA